MNKKSIWCIIVVFSYLLMIYFTLCTSLLVDDTVGKITSAASLTVALIIYAYQNWNWLFIVLNKIVACIFQKTVAYALSYKFYVSKNTDKDEIFDKLIKEYKNKSNYKSNEYNSNKLKIVLFSTTIVIKINDYGETKQINVDVLSSLSYRESKKATSIFFDIINFINTIVGPQLDGNYNLNLNIEEQKSCYKASIELEKGNPFYQYVAKHIGNDPKTSFDKMILNEKDVEIIIYSHKMVVKTKNKEKLEKVLKNYIPISTI